MGVPEKVALIFVTYTIAQVICIAASPKSLPKLNNLLKMNKNNKFTSMLLSNINKKESENKKEDLCKKYNFPEMEFPTLNNKYCVQEINIPDMTQIFNISDNCCAKTIIPIFFKNREKQVNLEKFLGINTQRYFKNSGKNETNKNIEEGVFGNVGYLDVEYPLKASDTWAPKYWNSHTFEKYVKNEPQKLCKYNPPKKYNPKYDFKLKCLDNQKCNKANTKKYNLKPNNIQNEKQRKEITNHIERSAKLTSLTVPNNATKTLGDQQTFLTQSSATFATENPLASTVLATEALDMCLETEKYISPCKYDSVTNSDDSKLDEVEFIFLPYKPKMSNVELVTPAPTTTTTEAIDFITECVPFE